MPEVTPPPPIRLNWDLKFEAEEAIERSLNVVKALINDIDLRIFVHDDYGKGFMKKCSLSPDAYIQMVLQLAYYRDAKRFCLTYEATMTRLYREGRTETVRPLTEESAAWVKAMDDGNVSVEERVKLLRTACRVHQVRVLSNKLVKMLRFLHTIVYTQLKNQFCEKENVY